MADDEPFKPIRNASEYITDNIPRGPLGYTGNGAVVGSTGLVATELVRGLVPGSEFDPGYRVQSHKVNRSGDTERHTFVIDAYTRNIAQFVARIRSVPSGVDYLTRNTKVVNVVQMNNRRTASTWKITVQSTERNQ